MIFLTKDKTCNNSVEASETTHSLLLSKVNFFVLFLRTSPSPFTGIAHKVASPNFHNCPSHYNNKKNSKEKEASSSESGGCKTPRFSIRRGPHCSCPSRFPINDALKQGRREAGMGQLATCWHSDFGCGRSQLGRELLSFACSCSSWKLIRERMK
ncbi:hypothetical protein CDAR_512581 [Caerostris darwini]|uniref:Uncharacterized protein n=1 Tax=Caerostris darwini TaxID=1538125 RepID=A0AAV4SWJ0_9ARAC|nr:hypothetical protein CDAR_512581 [Caerostris darwini]